MRDTAASKGLWRQVRLLGEGGKGREREGGGRRGGGRRGGQGSRGGRGPT
jgi:hypothetical protein